MEKVNSEIIKLAREARSITQEELARMIGVEQGTLSKIEKGILTADQAIIRKLSDALEYPTSFFYLEKRVHPVEGHYRRKISTSVKKMKQYIAQMTITEWHFLSMLDEIEIPDANLPQWDVTVDGAPAMCAKHVREKWKLPKGRITSLAKLIEDVGVVIVSLDFGELDGFSTYFGGNIPAIFINNKIPADRYRLTLAHELGHLLMHFGNKTGADRDLEVEAYEFAIEFLVPENSIKPYFTKLTIEKLADLKSYWHVSMAALLKYANSLEMVTSNQYRYLWTQLGKLGYKAQEPVNVPAEKPEIIDEIVNTFLSDLGYTKEELASTLHITVPDLEKNYMHSKVKLKAV